MTTAETAYRKALELISAPIKPEPGQSREAAILNAAVWSMQVARMALDDPEGFLLAFAQDNAPVAA